MSGLEGMVGPALDAAEAFRRLPSWISEAMAGDGSLRELEEAIGSLSKIATKHREAQLDRVLGVAPHGWEALERHLGAYVERHRRWRGITVTHTGDGCVALTDGHGLLVVSEELEATDDGPKPDAVERVLERAFDAPEIRATRQQVARKIGRAERGEPVGHPVGHGTPFRPVRVGPAVFDACILRAFVWAPAHAFGDRQITIRARGPHDVVGVQGSTWCAAIMPLRLEPPPGAPEIGGAS